MNNYIYISYIKKADEECFNTSILKAKTIVVKKPVTPAEKRWVVENDDEANPEAAIQENKNILNPLWGRPISLALDPRCGHLVQTTKYRLQDEPGL